MADKYLKYYWLFSFVCSGLIIFGTVMHCFMILNHNSGDVRSKDSQKFSNEGKTTQKFNIATKKASITKVKTSKDRKKPNVTCKLTKHGSKYRGHVNITKDGIPCQYWKDDKPHRPWGKFTIEKFPDDNFAAAKNYCRNPDDVLEGPWCYTMDPDVRWQYCDIKMCRVATNK